MSGRYINYLTIENITIFLAWSITKYFVRFINKQKCINLRYLPNLHTLKNNLKCPFPIQIKY